MRFVCISDTHERHRALTLPAGDVLVCAGDFTMNGQPHAVELFVRWMSAQPFAHKILVAGNHDILFEAKPSRAREILREAAPDVTYLQDSGMTIDGLRLWGSPWQQRFYDWAFNLDRYQLAEKWALIPAETEVLITHGPPFGIGDLVNGRRIGCEALRDRIDELSNLKLHIFGHCHSGYGVSVNGKYVNAAICDEAYRATREPIVMDVASASESER